MKDTLIRLLTAYGATGREDTVRQVIREMVAPYVDEMKVDALGNLITIKHGKGGKRVMLAAHMDHIGFVVTDIDDKGFLRVHNVGGIRRAWSLNRHVVFENGMHGVISSEERDVSPTDTTMLKLFIDIGAANREQAMEKVQIGDVAVYAPDVVDMGDYIASPAQDNRAGCAIVVETLKKLPEEMDNEVVAVFTTQEEVGLRGATAAAYSVNPDIGIALDVTLCGDTPKGPRIAVKAGEGIAIKVLDNSLICNPALVAKLEEVAQKNQIQYQREVLTGGGTDAGAIQLTRSGVRAGVLSVPCRYVHSATETVNIHDLEAGADLLAAYLGEKLQ